ncbi:VacJ family lipoprotein [Pararobbsia silviterrae]|uniref:VacJ family lipoprotein n=1 Tax=Pararobbsia silviterrae TaxID=1792498 RepID=A0A494X4W1_9BURK|nr:VacJ family lipoprotein [Pararobbsia silviterrae]RKP45728.1 VacJ family lipoprotein [Pararobbsia silviterrae]
MNVRHLPRLGALALSLALAACATTRTPSPSDPLEGMNRAIFTFNDTLDKYTFKPVAQGYQWAVPQPIRTGVTNVFANVGDAYTAFNELLQLKITDFVSDVMRVTVNTFWGLGGLFDVATLMNLPKHQQDFGLTMGRYGVPAGPYLVIPLLGPSDLRDGVGTIVDFELDPTSFISPVSLRNYIFVVRLVNTRANLLGASDLLSNAALDKYSFVRDAYQQRRAYLLHAGNGTSAPLPNYDDEGATDSGAAAPAAGAAPTSPGKAAPASPASSPAPTTPAPGSSHPTPAPAAPASDASPGASSDGGAATASSSDAVASAPVGASEPVEPSMPGSQMMMPSIAPALRVK